MATLAKRGIDLLEDPTLNKSTAFTEAEKQAFGLVGLVPDVTETEDIQFQRVLLQLSHKNTDLDRYIYLTRLLDHDETLFCRTVMSDPVRFLPIVYDPTIGEACLKLQTGIYASSSTQKPGCLRPNSADAGCRSDRPGPPDDAGFASAGVVTR